VDALLEAPPHGRVELPGQVRGADDDQPAVVVAHAVHLHEELGLDAVGAGAAVTGVARAAQGFNLVYEDDGGLALAGELEEEFDESEGDDGSEIVGHWL